MVLLSLEQREELESVVRRGTSEHRMAQRSRMVLMRADGVPVLDIARRLEVGRMSVRRWCDRYMERGFEGLSDLPRPGRPPSLSFGVSALH
ncbi:MAG TPA: helix-turn-helix domain-containing protein [Anaeromyxobacteraceae bacterium]|nr:helix-turn-helix domain-containing protein [Anaeromyxobacteraceae bacterium]